MLTRRAFIGSALGALGAALLPVAKLLRADKPVLPIQSTPSGHVNPYLELKEFQRRWLELAGKNIAVMKGRGFREGQAVYWSRHSDPTSFEPIVDMPVVFTNQVGPDEFEQILIGDLGANRMRHGVIRMT